MSYFNNLYRSFLNWGGDVKKLNAFPYVTWDTTTHKIDFDEILAALPLVEYGDIGLHREVGYLSNSVIPGFMKHGWIHVEDDPSSPKIVEAVSEGVIYRNAIYPLFSDYAMILSPKNVTEEERAGACKKAKSLVGADYDVNFKFDIEKELHFYSGKDKVSASSDLKVSSDNLKKYVPTFSCTEVVGYSWWHKREELGLFRTECNGKNVLKPDMFVNTDWKIKWMSSSITLDIAKKLGLHEEGLYLIEDYLCNVKK